MSEEVYVAVAEEVTVADDGTVVDKAAYDDCATVIVTDSL